MAEEYSRKEGFSLKKFLFGKINRKLVLTFLLIGLIPIIIFGILTISVMKKSMLEEISNKLLLFSEAKEGQIFAYLDSLEIRTLDFSSDGFIRDSVIKINNGENVSQVVKRLNNHLIENKKVLDPMILGILILDLNGKVIAATQIEEIGGNESQDEYFIKGKEGVFSSELILHKHFGFINVFSVSAPLTNKKTKELEGVIIVFFNTEKLSSILSGEFQLKKGAITAKKGKTETLETYLVDSKKQMFVHPISTYENETDKHFFDMVVDTVPVQKCLENNEEISGEFVNYNGEPVITASQCFIKTNWILVSEIQIKEAYALINKIYFLFIGIILFFSIFTILFALLFSRKISKPIKQLHKATEELEKGNFKERVSIKTGDEIEQLGKTFNKTSEALGRIQEEHKQLELAKTEFLSITSHELRSPMTPMRAQLQMLLKEYFGKLNKKQKEAVDIVLRNTERLDKIIMDFLEISRIEAARLKFRFVKVNLKSYIKDIIKEMAGFMPEKNIEIDVDIDKLPVIETDPDRIMQVLRNLINNAKKFSPKNSKIFIDVKAKKKYIFFSIRDQGIGLSKKDQIRIFEPFFQAEQTIYRKYKGTGLGLAISRGIVESQDGKIWVESKRGKGSTFYFTIPLKPVKEIKPIRLLFSEQDIIEKKILRLFNEILGPIGKAEFEHLRNKEELTKENLFRYVDLLIEQEVLDKEQGRNFKGGIANILESA